jgi:hypothetical protein
MIGSDMGPATSLGSISVSSSVAGVSDSPPIEKEIDNY